MKLAVSLHMYSKAVCCRIGTSSFLIILLVFLPLHHSTYFSKNNFSSTTETLLSVMLNVPDLVSQIRDVVLVRRIFSSGKPWGVRNLEWGGNEKGMRRGRSVYE
jgi:hypothetical protein